MEQLKKFARYFKPYKWSILSGILFILASMAFGLFIPYMVGQAVDDMGRGVTWQKVTYYPLVILGINLMSGVFLFLQRRLLINTSRHIEFDMRQDFYAALVDQPLSYFQANRVGDLMARGLASYRVMTVLSALVAIRLSCPSNRRNSTKRVPRL